jgi:nucleotide-binding universal stress UspA family protein
MTTIQNILFPVDFSPPCIAMAAYLKRSAAMFSAKLTLVHVFDLYGHDAFQFYVRSLSEVAEEQQTLARDKSPQPGALGRLRDLTYAIARDAPCPVLSV